MVRRTKKEFKDYNAFHDRPFGLKWGTAFALDDLMKGVRVNEAYALKRNEAKLQMTREQIDAILSESFLQTQEVTIQFNLLDEFGRLLDEVSGYFKGEAYQDYFVLNDQAIYWEDVRHIQLVTPEKWFSIELFEGKNDVKLSEIEQSNDESELGIDESFQPFYEEGETDESE